MHLSSWGRPPRSLVSEIVYDSEGNAFELRPGQRSGSRGMFGAGSSLRSALRRATSARSIVDDPDNREALARMLVRIDVCSPGEAPGLTLEEVRTLARGAFEGGLLALTPVVRSRRPICDTFERPTQSLIDEAGDEPIEPMRASHTLELELVDEDDEPISGEPYRVQLPDGQVIEGRLNTQGRAMLTGIEDSGNCQVTFPRLDAAVWEPM